MQGATLNRLPRRGRVSSGGMGVRILRVVSRSSIAAALLLNTAPVMARASGSGLPNEAGYLAAQADSAVGALSPGRPIERELKGSDRHSFPVDLQSAQFVRVVVSARGTDVVVTLSGPNGQKLTEATNQSSIEEEGVIVWVAETNGPHQLEIRPTEPSVKPGRYTVRITELRTAGPRDKSLIAGEKALAAGNQQLAGNTPEALAPAYEKFDEAVALFRAAAEPARTSMALRRKAFVLSAQGRANDALPLHREALRIVESEYGPTHLKVAPPLWDLAAVVAQLGGLAEARKLSDRAQQIVEQRAGTESLPAAIGLGYRFNLLAAEGEDNTALEAARRSIRIYEQRYGSESLTFAAAVSSVAHNLQRHHHHTHARPLFEQALKIYESHYRADAPELISTLFALARVLLNTGAGEEGLAKHARALRIIETTYGARSIRAANARGEMGNILYYLRRPAEARAAYQHSVSISPPGSPTAAASTLGIANTFTVEGDYAAARAKYDEAIKINEHIGGPNSSGVAYVLTAKAATYRGAKEYAQGSQLHEQAIKIYEEIGDPDVRALVGALTAAADYDEDHRKYQEARSKYERAIKIYENKEGTDSVGAAFFYRKIGDVLLDENRVDEALAAVGKALGRYEKAYGPNHGALIRPLKSLAQVHMKKNQLDDVRKTLERTVQILKHNRLDEDLYATDFFTAMAGLNHAEGNFTEASGAAETAVKIYENNPQHTYPEDEVEARNVYGLALLMSGKLPQARVEIEKTIALAEQKLGPGAPGTLLALTNMATLLSAINDVGEIAQHVSRVQNISTALVEGEDPQAIRVLLMTAGLAAHVGKRKESRELLDKVFKIAAAHAGPDDFVMTDLYTNEAMLLGSMGDYAGAEEAGAKADRLFKRFDPELLTRALLLAIRGELSLEQDKLPQARAAYEESARIFERRLGTKHYIVALAVNRLAWVYYLQGDSGQSRASYLKAAGATYHHVRDVLPTLSLAEQRLFLDKEIPDQVSGLLATSREGAALRSAYEPMFQWKGSLVDSLRRQTVITRLGRSGPHSELVKGLKDVRAEIAGWYYKVKTVPTDEWRQKTDELTRRKEGLERGLARALKPGELDDPLADGLAGFQRLLAPDEVFIDLYLYSYWSKEKPNEERYAAVLTGAASDPTLVDLGPAQKINRAVTAWRNEVLYVLDASDEWEALTKLLWKPLADALPSGTRKVWISPDGELARVPWQLLAAGPPGKGLLMTQTDSARELARLRKTRGESQTRATSILLAGDINFDAKPSRTSTRRFTGAGFERLDGAPGELASLHAAGKRLRAEVIPLTGADASKEKIVANVQKATYVHLITHGFFSRETRTATPAKQGIKYRVGPLGDAPPPNARNPLVESGIALAGANYRDPLDFDDKGLLTAEEIVGLDLGRCDLLTLSACETGRGEEVTGQGVMGLRASVMAAGARSMLMSLWRVPDEATVKFMEAFYDNLWAKKMTKSEALLRAQEAVRDHPSGKYRAPVNWAAWVLAGEAW